MELSLFVVADYANVTKEGKLNVMGIFNRINSYQFPAAHPEMFVIAHLTASPAEYNTTRKLTIKLLNEDATEEVVNWSTTITVPQGTGGRRVDSNHILKLQTIVFKEPGTYQLSLLVDQNEEGSMPLFVEQIPEPPKA